ncbi:MAG: shikimate kinase [Candidatus Methanodesulfokora sp.]
MALRGEGESWGAITIVCGLSNGRGVAAGIDLKVKAEVELIERDEVQLESFVLGKREEMGIKLVESLRDLLRSRYEFRGGIIARIFSEIPPERGLKSSSAVSNALILASLDAIGEKEDKMEILKMSVLLSRAAGITRTGALDDASASLLGGICAADSRKMEIVMRKEAPEIPVVLRIPEKRVPTSSVPDVSSSSSRFDELFSMVLSGRWMEAMLLNGYIMCSLLGYDRKVIDEAISLGALTASLSGKGPSFAAVCDEPERLSSWGNVVSILR